jgi:hypothetical protein
MGLSHSDQDNSHLDEMEISGRIETDRCGENKGPSVKVSAD